MAKPEIQLNAAMEDRRLALRLEWRDVADLAGVSYETLRALRKTGRASALSKRRLEDALRWEPGTIDAILSGNPVPALDEQELRAALAQLESDRDTLRVEFPVTYKAIAKALDTEIEEAHRRLRAIVGRNGEDLRESGS